MAYGPHEESMIDFVQKPHTGDSAPGAEIMVSWGIDAGEIHWVYSHCTFGRRHDCDRLYFLLTDEQLKARDFSKVRLYSLLG